MELEVGRHLIRADRAGKLHGTVMRRLVLLLIHDIDLLFRRKRVAGRGVHIRNASARAGVAVDSRLVAVILNQLSDVVENGGRKNFIDSAVRHRRVLVELGSLFDSALHSARNPEDHADDAGRFGEDVSRIHLRRRTFKTRHVADSADVGSGGKRRRFHHFTCQHSAFPPVVKHKIALSFDHAIQKIFM